MCYTKTWNNNLSKNIEIRQVYLQDISHQTRIVASKAKGKIRIAFDSEPFFTYDGYQTFPLFYGLIRESDYQIIGSIH